jgi:hypothetical protein
MQKDIKNRRNELKDLLEAKDLALYGVKNELGSERKYKQIAAEKPVLSGNFLPQPLRRPRERVCNPFMNKPVSRKAARITKRTCPY